MTGSSPSVRNRIPEFPSLDEEARFWDTHDTTEFEDEWEPVEITVTRPLHHRLSVRLDGAVFSRLVTMAKQRGVPTSVVAAELIREAITTAESNATTGPPEAIAR